MLFSCLDGRNRFCGTCYSWGCYKVGTLASLYKLESAGLLSDVVPKVREIPSVLARYQDNRSGLSEGLEDNLAALTGLLGRGLSEFMTVTVLTCSPDGADHGDVH